MKEITIEPTIEERNKNAEISTPLKLRQEMLNKIPNEHWTTLTKTFEPCCGKGGFLKDIIERYMEGLSKMYPNEEERYKIIIEKCLYFADINPTNVQLCCEAIGNYKINCYVGDTLEMDLGMFDLIVGNPPYNNSSGTGGSKKLWDKFVMYAIEKCINNGYIMFIHPPNWRKPENKILNEIKKYNLISLNILTEKECFKYFNCATKADYYLLQKCSYKGSTIINNEQIINISCMNFIPNCNFDLFEKIKGTSNILCPNTSYSSDCKWMCNDDKLKYKYIFSMNSKGVQYKYSNELKHYVNIPKVIVSIGRYPYPINDYKGEYGLSCMTFGIPIKSKEEGDNIIKCINSNIFKELLKNNKWGSYNIEWRMFKYFTKDFYVLI